MNKQVVGCLKRAKGLLVKYGWIQGRFGDKEHGFCAIGAIRNATESEEIEDEAFYALSVACADGGNIAFWNDRERRRKAEVLAAFDRAIKKAQRS